MERETGIEPATNSLEGCDSTTELLPQCLPVRVRLVAREGLEPSKPLGRQIYSLLRLTASLPRQLSVCGSAMFLELQPTYCRWSWRRDLNPRPADYKSAALPTELRQPEQKTNFSTSCASYASESVVPDGSVTVQVAALPATPYSTRSLGSGARVPSLPQGFEQHDSGRNPRIQALYVSAERNRREPVAALSHQTPQPGALGADDEGRRQREIDLVVAFPGFAGETDGPHAGLLQLFERTRDV